MAVLFEYFEDIDLPAERKKARDAGHAEGLVAGRAEGLAAGLERSTYDSEYLEELYREFHI